MNKEKELICKKLYEEGKTGIEIAKILNCSPWPVYNSLKKLKVKTRPLGPSWRKHNFNYSFFEKIDTEEKAYWLGFICADGSVKATLLSLRIEINSIDKKHLEKLVESIEYSGKIRDSRKECCILDLHSKKLICDLMKWGVGPNKASRLQEPNIPESLKIHFWRGVFDGDGWFNLPRYAVGFSCTSKDFTESFRNFIESISEKTSTKTLLRKRGTGMDMYQFIFQAKVQVAGFLRLYENAKVYLDRKHETAQKYLDSGRFTL